MRSTSCWYLKINANHTLCGTIILIITQAFSTVKTLLFLDCSVKNIIAVMAMVSLQWPLHSKPLNNINSNKVNKHNYMQLCNFHTIHKRQRMSCRKSKAGLQQCRVITMKRFLSKAEIQHMFLKWANGRRDTDFDKWKFTMYLQCMKLVQGKSR